MQYLVVFLVLFNLISWIVFLKKFRSLFTTDDIISKTKESLNPILSDLNRNVARNISLIDEKIAKLQSLIGEVDRKINESDRKLKLIIEQEKKSVGVSTLQNKISNAKNSKPIHNVSKRAVSSYEREKSQTTFKFSSDDTVELTSEAKNKFNKSTDSSLFDDEKTNLIDTRADVTVTEDGSYAAIPIVTPEVFVPEKTENSKKTDLKSKILELYELGYSVKQIADELSCSMTEIQFAIDLG